MDKPEFINNGQLITDNAYYQLGNILSPMQDNVIGQQVVDQFEQPDNNPSVSAISTKYSSLTNILSASTIN